MKPDTREIWEETVFPILNEFGSVKSISKQVYRKDQNWIEDKTAKLKHGDEVEA